MASEDKPMVDEQHLSSVSVTARIPAFWKKSPRTWFISAEAVLYPQKMSDEAKYQVVISKLSQDAIEQVTDLLLNPPETKKYETLKQKLILIYEESEDRQIKKLIGEMELGDQKPSQLMRRMQDLARGRVTDETLTILWQNHLPSSVRSVLAVADAKDMETRASIADKIMENLTPVASISTIQQQSTSGNENIIAEISKLGERLEKLETRSRSYNRRGYNLRRFPPRSRSRSRNRTLTPQDPNHLCYFHYKFRNKARKCVEPCNWNKKNVNQSEN